LGITSALWTRQAVQELIKQQVGIRLPEPHRGRVSSAVGLYATEAGSQSYKQDPLEVAEWLETTYPRSKRRAEREGVRFIGETRLGAFDGASNSRGYAHPGETPELIVPGNRFSVNMIATITNQGKVRWMIYTGR